MDRLNRILVGGGLAAALVSGAIGCRSTRPEVPPSRSYAPDGKQPPPIGFSSTPGVSPMTGLSPSAGTGALPGNSQFGTPAPGAGSYGAPTGNSFGPPGTSGMEPAPSVGAAAGSNAGLIPGSTPSVADPIIGLPQAGTGPTTPATVPGPGMP